MKLAMRLYSSHSTTSISLLNGGLRPCLTSKPLSVCGVCISLHHRTKPSSLACSSCAARLTQSRSSTTLIAPPSIPLFIASSSSSSASEASDHSGTLQRSKEWFALRRDRLTTSSFGTALGFWKGNRRSELWNEKVISSSDENPVGSANAAMNWGIINESAAIEQYKKITGREVETMGFAVHSEDRLEWIGASPDGVLSCFELGDGILEVKCPYNKGSPEKGLPWSKVPFYYMPQIQGQMEIMGRDWLDLYCWMPNGSTVFRVVRDREYWDLIHGILREFWWENVVPAREALALGMEEEEVKMYQPKSTHKLTNLVIAKSAKLASESKLLCREIAGHVEYF